MVLLNKIKIDKISLNDIIEIKKLIKNLYSIKNFDNTNSHLYYNLTENLLKYDNSFLIGNSIKLTYRNKIIGVMLMSEFSVNLGLYETENKTTIKKLSKYKDKRGLKNIFFGINKKYQNKGLGTYMIEYVKENFKEYDYLWGIQHKDISNVEFFLKRREFINEIDGAIYSVQNLQ